MNDNEAISRKKKCVSTSRFRQPYKKTFSTQASPKCNILLHQKYNDLIILLQIGSLKTHKTHKKVILMCLFHINFILNKTSLDLLRTKNLFIISMQSVMQARFQNQKHFCGYQQNHCCKKRKNNVL